MKSRADRVAAGAAWLDEVKPEWPAMINRDRLDMASTIDCVAGQVFGDYFSMPVPVQDMTELRRQWNEEEINYSTYVQRLDRWTKWARAHGFAETGRLWQNSTLRELWLAEVATREKVAA